MKKAKGQSIGEYALVLALVSAAILGMSIYVKRGIQARLKGAADYSTYSTQTVAKMGVYGSLSGTHRDDMAVFLARACNLTLGTTPESEKAFPDIYPGDWGYEEINALARAGIVNGYPDGLYHSEIANTRDLTATFIFNAYNYLNPKAPLQLYEHPAEPFFPDVPDDHWAAGFINALAQAGIVNGYPDGLYHPEYNTTRDQMAVFLARALGLEPYTGNPRFVDVLPGNWAYGAIGALYEEGIIQGFTAPKEPGVIYSQYEPDYQESEMATTTSSNNQEVQEPGGRVKRLGGSDVQPSYYVPYSPLTRAESLVMLFNALRLWKPDLPSEYSGPQPFNDVRPDYWAYDVIGICNQLGIIQGFGNPDIFLPNDTNSRAGAAVIVCQALGLQPVFDQQFFPDVPNDYWAAGSINALAKAGIVNGYPQGAGNDSLYRPELTLTRDQWAVFLFNAFQTKLGLTSYDGAEPLFSDVPNGYWAYGQIGAIYNAGITQGVLQPFFKETITRSGTIGPLKRFVLPDTTARRPRPPRRRIR